MCLYVLGQGLIPNSCNLSFGNFDNIAKFFQKNQQTKNNLIYVEVGHVL
jgi:hypothetical protein